MPITYGQAKEILAQYAGRGGFCPDETGVDLFVHQVLDYMLQSGAHGNIRKFCFNACKGWITAPYELETPLKIKIDGEVGTVWDKWFEWHSSRDLEGVCFPAGEAMFEDPNRYPTVYDVPSGGAQIGAMGICDESDDSYLIVQGLDVTGREVIMPHNGEQKVGEYLSIKKNQITYSQVTFSKITGIVKTKTAGYVQLLACYPSISKSTYLSDYGPNELIPTYRRFRLTSDKCNRNLKVSVLGRIRLKDYYSNTDVIPIDNLYALQLAGQAVNAQYNNNMAVASAKDQTVQEIITRENEYKRIENGQPIEVYKPLSAGRIVNIV